MQTRLATIAPVLAAQFAQSSKAAQMRAVLAACTELSRELEWVDDDVRSALMLMKDYGANTLTVRNKFGLLAEEFDEKYFEAYEVASRCMTDEVMGYFRKARAASAFLFGLSPVEAERHESIYEAAMASANQSDVLEAATNALKAA